MTTSGHLRSLKPAAWLLGLLLVLQVHLAISGNARHVVVSGGVSSGNAQDSLHGWTLSWALDPSNTVRQPGDTMYLHTGLYSGRNTITVSGTAGHPLVYRNWNGERVQLFDNNSDLNAVSSPWLVKGSYVWLWGMEVAHGNPANGGDADLISVQGSYDKIINCYIHDALSLGIDDFADGAAGTEVAGNVFQYNGRGPIHWNGSPYKSQPGYAAYVQNKVPAVQKLYQYNIVCNQWDCGMQFYGSSNTILSNIKVYRNVWFNNGNLWSESTTERYKPNFYVGPGETGAGPMDRDTVRRNISFYSMSPHNGDNVMLGYNGDGYTNFAVDSNYFISPNAGGSYTSVLFSNAAGVDPMQGLNSFRGNVVAGTWVPGNLSSTWGTSAGNSYYPSGSYPARGVEVFIDPNPYEAKRANITILNPGGQGTVAVNLSSVLANGDVYHIKAATNFNGPDIASGTYSGGTVTIDASSLSMSSTVGGYQTFQPVNPSPYLVSLVLLGPNVPPIVTTPPPTAPVVVTAAANNISASSAQLNGSVNPEGNSTTYHFEYGTTTGYGTSTSSAGAGSGSGAVSVSATLSGLTTGTVYHFRLVATNAGGTTNGGDATFTTGASQVSPPVVITAGATNVTSTGAQLNGTVNPEGNSTTYHFEYGRDTTYGTSTASTGAGSGSSSVAVTAVLTGLQPGTTYHYRLVASNSGGTSKGRDTTAVLATQAVPPPVVLTLSPTNITASGAQLNGSVNPGGSASTYHFEYGTSANYGSSTTSANAGAGTSAVPVSATLTGLASGTIYHYRLIATNGGGTSNGNDATVIIGTPSVAPPAVATTAASNISPSGAQLNGSIDPRGVNTSYYFAYGPTTAYGFTTQTVNAGVSTGKVTVSATVTGLTPGTVYHFQLVAVNTGGTIAGVDSTFVTPALPDSRTPDAYDLLQNYPNPFNPGTNIAYTLRKPAFVVLKIYNSLGVEVTTLVSTHQLEGRHDVHWEATGLASGIYFDAMTVDGVVSTRRMILLK